VYEDRFGSHQTRSRHVSAPDPRLGPDEGSGMFCPGTLGPHYRWLGPHTGGPDPILGVQFAHVEALGQTWRLGPYIQWSGTGPRLSHGGPNSLLMPWSISLSLETWRLWIRGGPGPAHVVGSGVVAGLE
jgi:hypothetical protein